MARQRRTAPAGRAGTRWRRRAFGFAAAVAITCLLGAAGYGFVLKSLPYHTPQLPPPRVRLTAQDVASFALYPAGVTGVPVITWRDVSGRVGALVTTPVLFARELAVLRRDGFRSVRLSTLAALAAGRHVKLPARPVVLTFDDGLSTDWTTVDPILRQYGFTAVVFVNPDDVAVKSPSYFLTGAELSAMAASGRWEVGLQFADERLPMSRAERRAAGLPPQTAALESVTEWSQRTAVGAAEKRAELQNIIGAPVTAYAWPVALTQDANDTEAPQLLNPVLKRMFDVVFGRPAAGAAAFVAAGSDAHPLPRLEITAETTLKSLSASLMTGVPSLPPPDPLTLPWTGAGGRCGRNSRVLTLRGRGFALCTVNADGSRWQNYELRLQLGFAKSADLTAIIELRSSTAGRIEIAIGSIGVSIKQLVGQHWSVLSTDTARRPVTAQGVTLSFLRTGVMPVTVRLTGSLLRVQAGSVTTRAQVSPAVDHGVIAVGLVSPARSSAVTYSGMRITGATFAPTG